MPPIMKQPWEYDKVNQRYNFNPTPGMIDYDPASQTWNDTGQQAAPGQLDEYLRTLGAAPSAVQQQRHSLGNVGNVAQPQVQASNDMPAGSSTGTLQQGNPISVRMPDGSIRTFGDKPWADPALDAALKTPGVQVLDPLDPSRTMTVTPGVYGGYLFDGLPINVIAGYDFLPLQKEALSNYYASGWKPGDPALTNPPALPQGSEQYYPGGQGAGAPFDFGYLAQVFNEKFQAPGGAPGQFKPPTAESVGQDPGVQYRLQLAEKATGRAASAGGYLNSGRALQEMNRNIQDVASQEYGKAFDRDFAVHQGNVSDYERNWNREMQEFQQRYNVDTGNKTNLYNRFQGLTTGGQVSAAQLGQAGMNLGNQVGNNLDAAAIAAANSRITAAGARRTAAGNILGNVGY